MVDFGALPPEINSARMYAGPGAGPMMAAAAAWNTLAAALGAAASSYGTATTDLTDSWQGPSSVSMVAAAAPYLAWMSETATRAQQSATQASTAAAAYQAAFAATVPPPVIEANRALLMSLVATNFLGQNTPAIAAAEAAYAEMWAQDATTMYGYAASASAATALTPFRRPPQMTSPTGQSGQSAAVAQAVGNATAGDAQTTMSQLMSALPQQLHTLASAGSTSTGATNTSATNALSPVLTAFSDFNTLSGPLTPMWQWTYAAFQQGSIIYSAKADFDAHNPTGVPAPAPQLVDAAPTGGPNALGQRGAVLASAGRAPIVGKLSVPQAWAAATPATEAASAQPRSTGTAFRALPGWANPATNLPEGLPPSSVGPMRGVTPAAGKKVLAMRDRRFKMPRPAVGG